MVEDEYETACRRWAEGRLEVWRYLRRRLEDVPGWEFEAGEPSDDEPSWIYSPPGKPARLVVTVHYQNLSVQDLAADKEMHMAPGAFDLWLDRHESDYA